MTTTELLKKEVDAAPSGRWSPDVYKAMAYREPQEATVPEQRARACHALFSQSKPFIYKNDWIAGSMRSLCLDIAPEAAEASFRLVRQIGERSFSTNFDHFAADYWMITEKGIPGILQDLAASRQRHPGDVERIKTLSNMTLAMEGLLAMIRNYRQKAEALVGQDGYAPEKLGFIADNLRQLEVGAPTTFAQALQLVWLCHMGFVYEGRYAQALGRIDQYLYPFYKKDLEKGILTDERAVELLENVFIKICERRTFTGNDDVVNICIGGRNLQGESEVNGLSFCVLWAVRNCNVPGPNLSARIASVTPDAFVDECLKVIGTGLGYPALMNDETNIRALSQFPYDPKDVANYCMVGCIENFLPGKQPPWSDGRFDTPRFLEYVFSHGKGIFRPTNGLDTGDVDGIHSMADFMSRLERQLAEGVRQYVEAQQARSRLERPEDFTSPYLSCFSPECISRGQDINLGGAKYPSVHGAALMGIGTLADSLAAVEQTVFVDKTVSLKELQEALQCNFEGREALRHTLLAAPKYGNNNAFVDKYAVWFMEFLHGEFSKYRTADGGWYYTLVAANVSNISAGREIGATPDGRLAGEPLSDASSPTYGRDVSGSTSTLLSCAKPDYTKAAGGTVLNQKFYPSMFKDGNRDKLLALIRGFFQLGGQEIQINATSTEVLKDAMRHPENYRNLVVRVSGFSAWYVTLDKSVQKDILSRTQQQA